MSNKNTLEVWLRGPVPSIPPLLQPVVHALLQAREEINGLMQDFPDELLWEKPAGVASPGFHLQHLTGVLDRLLTYARGEMLTDAQLHYLRQEEVPIPEKGITIQLVQRFTEQVDKAAAQIASTSEDILTQPRAVGRAQLPSTVMGLLFHAAEHTQRHTGQLMVTVKVLRSSQIK